MTPCLLPDLKGFSMPGRLKMRMRPKGFASEVYPTPQNLDQFRVTFIQLDGMPLDVWYTFENRSEAEAFAKQVHEADGTLRPEIIAMNTP